MELITYSEATKLLDISADTLQQAMKPERGVLTKAGRKGRNMLLIKEQVMLFVGVNPRTGHKKRLSLEALTPEENILWQRYADEASSPQPAYSELDKLVEEKVYKKFNEEIAKRELQRIQEEERIAAQDALIRAQQKEKLTKDYPFLVRELASIA